MAKYCTGTRGHANDLERSLERKGKSQREGGRRGSIVLSPCIYSPAPQMQGQQQEHQPHPSTLTPQEKGGEEKSFPRTHPNRCLLFFSFFPLNSSSRDFSSRLGCLPPSEGAPEGEVREGDTPPDQVGCASRRHGAGEPANRTGRMLA